MSILGLVSVTEKVLDVTASDNSAYVANRVPPESVVRIDKTENHDTTNCPVMEVCDDIVNTI